MIVDFFRPGNSFLHRFDPRAKLILLAPLFACFFLPVPPWVQLPYAVVLGVVIVSALGLPELLKPLRAIAPVLILICLLTPPFHREGRVLLRILSIPFLTSEGLVETFMFLIRFLGITLAFVAVFRSIDLDELVLSLRWFGLPYSICLVVVIAFRYIPSLSTTWRDVVDAHKLRSGASASRGRGRLVERYLPVLTSVLIQAVKGMPTLAMVLESRGFGRSNPRTSYVELKKGVRFFMDMLICFGCAVLLLVPAFLQWP